MASVWTFKYGLLFPVMALAFVLGWRRDAKWRAVMLFLVILTLAKHDRLDMLYANYLTPLWYLAVGLLAARSLDRAKMATLVGLSALVAVFAITFTYALIDTQLATHAIPTPGAVLYTADPVEAHAWADVYAAAAHLTPPGSTAFAWPYVSSFYPLSQTVNPSRLDFVVPGQHDEDEIASTIATVRAAKPAALYYFPFGDAIYVDNPRFDRTLIESSFARMQAALTPGYKRYTIGPAILFVRQQ